MDLWATILAAASAIVLLANCAEKIVNAVKRFSGGCFSKYTVIKYIYLH